MQHMAFRGCFPFVRSLVKEETYKLNPAFKRLVITAKNNNRAVSEMIKIDDPYVSFCIDETADYLYLKLLEEARNKNQDSKEDFNTFMNKYSKRK